MAVLAVVIGTIMILVALLIIVSVFLKDEKAIDNSDGHIICAMTNKPCIKNEIFPSYNNCEGCLYNYDE